MFFYLMFGIFMFLGLGTLNAAAQTKVRNTHLVLCSLCYLSGAIAAYLTSSWWPFIISFCLVFFAGSLFRDPVQ